MDTYDIYELMMIPPNKKAELIVKELHKGVEADLNLIKNLIVLGANLEWQGDSDSSWPVLHMFVIYNQIDIAKMLIDAGADVSIRDEYERTALHVCANWNHPEILGMLLDAGVDVNIQDERGETALYRCAWKNHPELARILIDAGADVNIQDDNGSTALHVCASDNNPEIARMLLDAGADKTIQNNQRRFPYELANTEELKELLKV